jgi:hypothetical protein
MLKLERKSRGGRNEEKSKREAGGRNYERKNE